MFSAGRRGQAVVAVLAMCLGLGAQAQQHGFRQFTPEEGLAQSQVRCMAQDADGYLWIGTLGGASKFDGYGFVNHALQEGLPDAHVSALQSDAQGTLWLGSGNTLVKRVGQRFLREELPFHGSGARIMALAADGQGHLFIGTDGEGLFLRDANGSINALPGYPQDTAANVRALLALPDGRLLVGLRNGLLLWDSGTCTTIPLGDAAPKAVSALAADAKGNWWVGTFLDGLYRIAPNGTQKHYDEENGLLRDNVRCLLVDDRNRLWVGTKFGLNLLEEGRLRVFTVHQGLPNDNIWSAFQDSEGNVWFGTDGAGALRFSGDRFVTFTMKDGLCSDLIMSMVVDQQGDHWLGTYDNGVCRMDGMAMVNTLDGMPNNTVWCSLMDRNGALWFGTSDGLAKLERGVVQPLPPNSSLTGQRVLALHEDDQGNLWAGTREGLSVLAPNGTVTHHAAGTNGPGRSVRSIVHRSDGSRWLASDNGVSRYHGGVFRTYGMEQGLGANTVMCLLVDGQGRLWAGTSNGLSVLQGDGFRNIRFGKDFGSNHINLLVQDGRGRVWAGSNNGLFLFMPDSLLQDEAAYERIGINKGLRSLEFNLNAGFLDGRGRLFLGSAGGLLFHDVERHKEQGRITVPRVHITGVRSFLQNPTQGGPMDSLDQAGLPVGLTLPYGRNYLTFDYTAISLAGHDRVTYRYRMLGVDENWLPATDARFASYSNLPQGEYSFEVAASVAGGPWSEPDRFTLHIEPPFWLRWWFFLGALLVIAGLLFAVLRIRANRRARRERTRQLMLRSRMLQLEQQALNANMNRHFVFNALNSIQYHINKQDRATASRYLTSFAKLIRKNLDASQSDTTTLAEELERLELYLILEHMRFKDRFRYAMEVTPGVDTQHVRLPAMMLQPYVENSIWHGLLPLDRQGQVTIRVQAVGADRVQVSIEDDGIGLEQSRARKHDSGSDHISRGIEITKGRADVLRRLDITDIRISGPDELLEPVSGRVLGTRVTVELPISTVPQKSDPGLQNAVQATTFGSL